MPLRKELRDAQTIVASLHSYANSFHQKSSSATILRTIFANHKPITMDMDDLEIDPAMAEAMGFSSFGSKRRKHAARADDAFIDDSGTQIPAITGANDIPLGARPVPSTTTQQVQEQESTEHKAASTVTMEDTQKEQPRAMETKAEEVQTDNWTPGFPAPQELSALRRGVKNARGDMVVFMPSFIEDPWKGLG
jgi:hypothetical protein